jgi:hypothetical protein
MIRLAPAIVVHSARHVRDALGPDLPVTLVSASGAASYAGAAWWIALMAAARAETPGRIFADILDCGDAPGRAAEALRLGQRRLVLHAVPPAIFDRVRLMAEACGATVLPAMPEALDLARPGAARQLAAWLQPGPLPAAQEGQGDKEGAIG